MGFMKGASVLYLALGIVFALGGLVWLLISLAAGDAGNAVYGALLLGLGAFRILWSIGRIRILSQAQQRQAQQRQAQRMPYGGQPGYGQPGYGQPGYPPQQYGQQPGYPPQQYGGQQYGGQQYGGQFAPQQPQQYPPQPGSYGQPGDPSQGGQYPPYAGPRQ